MILFTLEATFPKRLLPNIKQQSREIFCGQVIRGTVCTVVLS